MAKHDRCAICDYNEHFGSSLAGVGPGAYGKVRRYGNDFLCQVCADEISSVLEEPEDDEPVGTD